MSEPDDGYQPVRIASQTCPFERELNEGENSRWAHCRGKIIFVRPILAEPPQLCPSQHYEVRPDSVEIIYGHRISKTCIACDHQILAD